MRLEHIVAGFFLTQTACHPPYPELSIIDYTVAPESGEQIHEDDALLVTLYTSSSFFDPSLDTFTAEFITDNTPFSLSQITTTPGPANHRYESVFTTTLSPFTFSAGNHLYTFETTYSSDDGTFSATLPDDVLLKVLPADAVECTAPSIFLDAISSTLTNDSIYNFSAQVSSTTEGCSVDSVTLTLDNADYTMNLQDSSIYIAAVDLSALSMASSPAKKQYSVAAISGDATNAEYGYFTLEDALAPEIMATAYPDPVDNLASATLTLDATITDKGTGVNASAVYAEFNDSGSYQQMTLVSGDNYTLEVAGNTLTTPESSYTIHAFDTAGLEATYTDTFEVTNVSGLSVNSLDLLPDTVSNATVESVVISYDVADEQDSDGTLNSYCMLDETLLAYLSPVSGTLYQGTFDTTDFVVAQDYTITCFAEDSESNTVERDTTLTITDGIAPEVSSANTTVGYNDGSAPVIITANAIDETASLLTVSYSSSFGSGALALVSGTEYQASVDVTGLRAGAYNISLSVSDGINTTLSSVTGTIEDRLAPTISGCSVSSTSLTSPSGTATVECTITDETLFDYANLSVGSLGEFALSSIGSGIYRATIRLDSNSQSGTYTLELNAYDVVGNVTTYTSFPSITILDGVDPSLSCTVTDGTNDGSQNVEMLCTAFDESSAVTVSYYSSVLGSGFLTNTSGYAFEEVVSVLGVSAQDYSVLFTATDVASNNTSATLIYTINDLLFPIVGSCSLVDYTLATPSDSTTATCSGLSDETGIDSVVIDAGALGVFPLTVSGSTATGTITVSSSSVGAAYTPVAQISDGANVTTYTLSDLTIVDGVSPTILSVYADPSSLYADGIDTFQVIGCFEDETDGTHLEGTVEATIDTLVEPMAYNSSTECFETADIYGSDLGTGTYSITVTGSDVAGNTVVDSSAYVEITCPSVEITFMSVSPSTVYVDNLPMELTVTAEIADICGTVDTAYVTIDGVTEELVGSGTYTATINAFDNAASLSLDTHIVEVAVNGSLGDVITDNSQIVTIDTICSNLSTDASTATHAIYVDGSLEAYLTGGISTTMSAFDFITLGNTGAQFMSPVLLLYNETYGEHISLASCSGGTYSAGIFSPSGENDCALTTVYNCSSFDCSVSVDVISGSTLRLELDSSTVSSGRGSRWYKSVGVPTILTDGYARSTGFYSGEVTSGLFTLCLKP